MILTRPPKLTAFRRFGAMIVLAWPVAAQADVEVNWDLIEELDKNAGHASIVLRYPGGEPRALPSLRYPDIDSRGDEVILIPPRPAVPPITLIPPGRPTRALEAALTPPSAETAPPPQAAPSEPVDVAPLEQATIAPGRAQSAHEPVQQFAEPKRPMAPPSAPVTEATQPTEPAAEALVETVPPSPPTAQPAEVAAATAQPAPDPAPRPTVTASLPDPATATDALNTASIPPAVPGTAGERLKPIRLAALKTHNEPTDARPLAARGVAPVPALAQILFEAESAALPGMAKDNLNALAGELAQKAHRIELQAFGGTAGDRSTPARRLSLKRALAVRAYLIALGVDSNRIDVHAIGGAQDGGPTDRVDVVTSSD